MKTQILLLALLAAGLASCDDGTTTTTTNDTAVVAPAGDPNMITTTTTTTTTRPAYIPKPNVQYIDLRTKEKITVRVDTVNHYIVNTVTNQPVDFFMEPGTTDTIYGRNMVIANGLINYGTGTNWTYDESLNTTTTSGESKEIDKMKTNEDETKIKYKDGSKTKTTNDETKVKR